MSQQQNMVLSTANISDELTIVGGAIGFNWLPVIVAQRRGFFENQGIRVNVTRVGSVDKATAAVKSGNVQMAITPPEGAIRDAIGGGKLRIIAGNVNRLPLSLIAAPRYHRIEDLKGAKLGTSSLTEGTAIYTIEMLSKHGLNYPGDFEFSVVGVHPARWKALQDGTIDAAVQLIPLNFVAVDHGYSNLGEVSDYIPEIAFSAVIVDDSWAQSHSAVVVKVLRGLCEANQWVYQGTHDAELLPYVMELTQSDEKYAKMSLDYMQAKNTFDRSIEVPSAAFSTSVDLMRKAALINGAQAAIASRVLDDSYRASALAQWEIEHG
jgi:ABC-type nitrate/sulfonate/bicarbonate transport system substrate-binding protein